MRYIILSSFAVFLLLFSGCSKQSSIATKIYKKLGNFDKTRVCQDSNEVSNGATRCYIIHKEHELIIPEETHNVAEEKKEKKHTVASDHKKEKVVTNKKDTNKKESKKNDHKKHAKKKISVDEMCESYGFNKKGNK